MALEIVHGQPGNVEAAHELASLLDRELADRFQVRRHHARYGCRLAAARLRAGPDLQRARVPPVALSKAGRKFAVDIVTVTVFAAPVGDPPVPTEAAFRSFDELPTFIGEQQGLGEDLYRSLQAALQRVSTIRPAKRRAEVKSADSRGAAMKAIEGGIANLDFWQKKAAIETPAGPQRIRGLAGSGKTIVLALKAALLHAQKGLLHELVTSELACPAG